jgi:lactoylglutathione lyase
MPYAGRLIDGCSGDGGSIYERNSQALRQGKELRTMTDNFRLMHTMVRVKDQDKAIDFYTRLLGMKILRQSDNDVGKYTNTFLGYGEEDSHTVLELTYNWDENDPYELGRAFGHLAVGVPDVAATCEAMEKEGVSIPRPAGPVIGGTTIIAFVKDPDGRSIELIQAGTGTHAALTVE